MRKALEHQEEKARQWTAADDYVSAFGDWEKSKTRDNEILVTSGSVTGLRRFSDGRTWSNVLQEEDSHQKSR